MPGTPLPGTRRTVERRARAVVRERDSQEVFVAYRVFMCVICGFLYEEEKGLPEEGIAPGTRWEDIPDTWTCPDCGATKDDFEMIEV